MKAAFNTFSGGMSMDSDKSVQQKNTYRTSINGRLVFKTDGTMAWSNIKGNKVAFNLTAGYEPKGAVEIDSKLIILSYNSGTTYSEIGYVELDDSTLNESKITPTYVVMFNDQSDPNSEKLNLTSRCEVHSYAEVSEDGYLTNTGVNEQNEFLIERIYWTDNVNEPRSFNLGLYFYIKKNAPTFEFNNPAVVYTAILPNGEYVQSFYSVHNMSLNPDMKMGWIEHSQTKKGNLSSGQYMYTYRLITKDGKTSSWIPVTNKMTIVDLDKDSVNWNKYHMGSVGVNSGKSNELFVYINDTRWRFFEVAYVYYSTELASQEAKIFFNGEIDQTGTAIHTIEHTDNTGVSTTAAALQQAYIPIEKAKTMAIKNKTLLFGNYKERNPIELSAAKLSAITMKPFFKLMRTDETVNKTELPLTHQATTNTSTWKSLYLDRTDTADYGSGTSASGRYHKNALAITADYRNYKGVQVETSFAGYFRGETYRVGIVFYDKKGRAGFVQHIGDITMPEMHGRASDNNTYYTVSKLDSSGAISTTSTQLLIANDTASQLSGGGTNHPAAYIEGVNADTWPLYYSGSLIKNSVWGIDATSNFPFYMPGTGSTGTVNDHWARIMGLWIDNIDLTDIIDDISGFEIVRAKRDERIVGKGLLLPTSTRHNLAQTDGTYPTPIIYNKNLAYAGPEGYQIQDRAGNIIKSSGSTYMNYRPSTFNFLSPDLMMDSDYNISGQDKIRLEGVAYQSFKSTMDHDELDGDNSHFMVKLYETFKPSQNSFYTDYLGTAYTTTDYLGTDVLKSFTKLGSGNSGAAYDPGNSNYIFRNYYKGDNSTAESMSHTTGGITGFKTNNGIETHAYGSNDNIILVSDTWRRVVPNFNQGASGDYTIAPPIVSIYREGGGTYSGVNKNSLAATSWEAMGEFTRMDSDLKAKILTSGDYILDGKETWGGDCYLDIFDMAYLIPWYQYGADCATPEKTTDSGDRYDDFALGLVFPIESKYNFMLHRTEHGYAGVGTKPQIETEDGVNRSSAASFKDGLLVAASSCHSPITEQFTDSGLGHVDNSEFGYISKPILHRKLVTFPYSWAWSTSKTHGETYDNFTTVPVANKLDLEGKHGEITSSGTIGDMLVSFQETAFGKLPVKDRAVLPSGGTSLVIGNASFMDRIDYASTNVGNKNQFSLVSSGSHLFWTDITNSKLYQFGGGGLVSLNDAKGFHNYFEEILKSAYGTSPNIHSGYDHKNHEVYFSILLDPSKLSTAATSLISKTGVYSEEHTTIGATIIYNTHLKAFTSFISAIPNMWFSFGDNFYSTRQQLAVASSQEKVYIYNENTEGTFFDTLVDSKIDIVVNDISQYSKVFDNIVLNINNDGYGLLKTINISTDDQTQSINVLTDTRAKYREQFYRLPLRGVNESQRVRGKWTGIEFVFKNESDKEIVFTDLETKYRISNRV